VSASSAPTGQTLLKILGRVTAPTEGTVEIRGKVASPLEVGAGFNPT
jgi:lipopolysaccharide transport system ATP-binding protein